MIINIQDDILKLHALGLLDKVLADKTTKHNIIWAANAYSPFGARYGRNEEISPDLIIGPNASVIKTRARKAMEQQSERTRQHAEVFTPLWVCRKMNDHADEVWFESPDVFFKDGIPTASVEFSGKKTWKHYVDSRRLEITCGEAPYLVSRYDVESGESIPIQNRVGLLDRKLRVVGENAQTEEEWLEWAERSFWAAYGYDFQGDNVLIARVNLLMTFEEYLWERWKRKPTTAEYEKIAAIIAWNLWQMDGLTGTVPYGAAEAEFEEIDRLGMLGGESERGNENKQPPCLVYNWTGGGSVEFVSLPSREKNAMKFDFVIGNPPYQDENIGANNQAKPLYNLFMDGAYAIGDAAELITPARFLNQAGATPKAWNKKMLDSNKIKVLFYSEDSAKVFNGVDIKGGVVITYFDKHADFEPIGVFIKDERLRSIFDKAKQHLTHNIGDLVHSPDSYRFTDKMFEERPELIGRTDKAHAKAVASNVFDRYPEIFEESTRTGYVKVVGRKNGERKALYTKELYLNDPGNLHTWKVLVAGAIGTGSFGEALSDPIVVGPEAAHTQTFVSMGEFKTNYEAESLAKYLKTKFARALLGIMKTTQNNQSKTVWSKIPLQDFNPDSDIDWSKSIPEIDRQLYAKYGLDEKEIEFIETHVVPQPHGQRVGTEEAAGRGRGLSGLHRGRRHWR